jgi:hypothetical protein
MAGLVRAAQTRDRVELKSATDMALGLTRTRRVGLAYALRLGLWGAMTCVVGRSVGEEDLWPLTDRVFGHVATVLATDEEGVLAVLSEATATTSQRYYLAETEPMLVAVVSLVELMKIAPPPGNDIDALRRFIARHWAADHPHEVEHEWITLLGA